MNQSNQNCQVWQGEISQLRTEAINVHFLKNIKQHKEMAGTVAMLQAAVGQAGAVISSQAATDEGDPVEGFAMQVAGKTVRGSFWKVSFQDGDNVQVIGHEHNGVFEAIAVTKPEERIIWMQPHCERGTQSKKKHLLKCSGWFVLLGLFSELILSFFIDPPVWPMLLGLTLAIVVGLIVTVGMSWGDFMNFAREMNAVGTALDLPEPADIDLFKSTKLARKNGRPALPMGVYYY
jgi:hypothetical protein